MALTQREEEDMRKILVNIFGSEATLWPVTESSVENLGIMLKGLNRCSKAMNYVPRPEGIVDKSYLKRQLRNMARRAGNEELYEACRVQAARNWKSVMASGQ